MSRILIFEGFDLVGKTTYAKTLVNNIYRPDYSVFDKYYSRNLAFMFGYAQADIWSYCKNTSIEIPEEIAIDRGLFSSYVYSRIYRDTYPRLHEDIVISYLMKLINSFDQVEVYNVNHKNKTSAREIYDYNQFHQSSHNEQYDYFLTFEEYFERYLKARDLFEEIYYIVRGRLPRSYGESFSIHQVESFVEDGELRFEEVDHS